MSEWREVTLSSISDRVDYGYTTSAVDDPKLPRFLRITDIVGSHIDWSRVPGCAIERQKVAKFAIQTGDIVVARTGATVGHAKRIRQHPDAVFASYLVRFRPSLDVDARYVGAVIESQLYKNWVLKHAGGAAQPNANAKLLGSFRFLLPSRRTQALIGSTLDALDELIENNRRRIELLEQMAQRIYREWFVRFRYPGHEDALLDPPLGHLPPGWGIKPLGSIVELDRTSIEPSNSPDEEFDHYSIPAFDMGQLPVVTAGKIIRSGKYLLNGAAILVSKLNPRIERTWFAYPRPEHRSVASTEFLVLRPKLNLPLEFVYLLARSQAFQERLRELSGGTSTSHQRAKPDDFLRVEVIAPDALLMKELVETVGADLRMVGTLRLQNRGLTAIRDLLLPKLVTGQIDVSTLDLGSLVESVA